MHNSLPENPHTPVNQKYSFHWSWAAILAVITLATLVIFYALPIRDGDIFFHLLYAKYFLKHHTLIPDHTIYSWTPASNARIYCAWLSELFFLLLYKLGQFKALVFFRYCGALFFVFLVWRYAKQVKTDSHPLTWLICLLGVLMSHAAIFAKPEIFSYVFMTLIVWNWYHIRSNDRDAATWKRCYVFPLIMLLWVNSHGAFAFGALFLLLVGLGEALNSWLCPWTKLTSNVRKHLFISLVLSGIAFFITPYGYHYPAQLLSLFFTAVLPGSDRLPLDETKSTIGAWQSPFNMETNILNFANLGNTAICILLVLLLLNLRSKKIDWSSLLTNFVFVGLYTMYIRTTYFWAPVFAFCAISLLSQTSFLLKPVKFSYTLYIGIFAILLSSYLGIHTIPDTKCLPESSMWKDFGFSDMFPVDEADFIKINYPHARIGNTYGQGTYLMWVLYPENKIFFDGRHFPYQQWVKDLFSFQNAQRVKPFLEKYQADIWCIDIDYQNLVYWFLASPEWQPVFAGKIAIIFAKKEKTSAQRPALLFSERLLEPSNAVAALHTFNFLINMQEWQKASQLLKYIENTFSCTTAQKEMHETLQHYLTGALAYQNKEYETAIQYLAKSNGKMINCSRMLAWSLLHSAAENWEKGALEKAFKLTDRAWFYDTGNLYSLYNAGIITWYLDKYEHTRVQAQTDWHALLQAFLEVAPQIRKYEKSISTAEKILAGNFTEETRPQLLVPPEPEIIPDAPRPKQIMPN